MTNPSRPVFSIIIPTFNRPAELRRAIESVCRQTYRNFELIVVDDCSEIDYASEFHRASGLPGQALRTPRNLGAGGARNAGLRVSLGKYVSFLDDDDEFGAEFLASTLAALRGTPATTVISWCGVYSVSDFGDGVSKHSTRVFGGEYRTDLAAFEDLMSIGTGFGVTIKADFMNRSAWFDQALRAVEDADLFLRVIAGGYRPTVVPGIHVTIHRHGHGRLTDIGMHKTRIKECKMLIERYEEVFNAYPSLRAQLLRHVSNLEAQMGSLHV
jgi:glycosyltransferase involved in cell wall biosynthesis